MGFQGTCEGDLGLLNQAAICIRSVAQNEASKPSLWPLIVIVISPQLLECLFLKDLMSEYS